MRREEVVGVVGTAPARRSGGLRTGTDMSSRLMGFLLGFASASSIGLYYFQGVTETASSQLLESVEKLQRGAGKISSHLERLQAVEKEMASLKAGMAARDDVGKVRGEMRKLHEGLHLEMLDLRAHVWGVEQDLGKVVKQDSINI
ncbi:uncharacterized protein MKK02DRAFT_39355 [Dioszegia hungarica]|uniref:Uncharacterized protein n=1 Tax=Dioszegia hungarica TaxID=4972 RepID=A0AA38HEC3_9TREE|nr:uncharacterized protein MKK02DRAFT_39355 [Dioszegia hungarica]KAI9639078.1 hypothetical protein MKK02DRAFT_39355 [Dioszegia hungarica]